MPYPSWDSLPERTKTFLKKLGARKGSNLEKMWRRIFNSCIKKHDESRCFKMANGRVKKFAKGDSLEWTDLPDRAKKAIKDAGGSSMSPEFDMWIRDYEYCRNKGGDLEPCIEYATRWAESRTDLTIPDGPPWRKKMKINSDVSIIHNPVEFFENDEMKRDEGTDSVTNKAVLRVPTVFTREGVMNRRYKPWDELEKTFWTLERKPIIIPTHPEGGSPVTSAHIDRLVGYVSDVHLNQDDKSVRGYSNYYLDHEWVAENKDEIGTKQRAVSIGYYALTERAEGAYNGIAYEAIDRSMYFDHNAHLVKAPAACPLPDCGLMVNEEGFGMTEEKKKEKEKIKENRENIIELARQSLFDTGIFESPEDIPDLMVAELVIDGCCSDEDGRELFEEDQKFTFSPPWGSVDKTKLPRSAFAIKGDPDKKTTWKFPYKNPDGSINCNGVAAARRALAGARRPAKISSADRSRLNALFKRLWASCQRLRERQGDSDGELEKPKENSKQLNTQTNINKNDSMSEENKNSGEETKGDTKGKKKPEEKPVETPPVDTQEDTDQTKEPKPEVRPPVADVESKLLASENVYLRKQIQTLTDELAELKEAEKQREEARVKSLRETISKLNSDFQIFEKEEIEAMDEGELSKVVQAMQIKARPELREVYTQTIMKKPKATPYRSDEYAELTVFATKKKEKGE